MYSELDKYLSGYFNDDYWYDEGFSIAREILSEFNDDDWVKLQNQVLLKDIEWQKKLAYCIDNTSKIFELETLLMLSTVNDKELFNICIDSLRIFVTNDEYKKAVSNNQDLLRKVNEFLTAPNGGIFKGIYQSFIEELKK